MNRLCSYARIALMLAIALASGVANAYPPSTAWRVNAATCFSATTYVFSSQGAACNTVFGNTPQILAGAITGSCTNATITGFSNTSVVTTGSPTDYNCRGTLTNSSGAVQSPNPAIVGTVSAITNACPSGGTLSGGNCVCGSGFTDSGTACVGSGPGSATCAFGVSRKNDGTCCPNGQWSPNGVTCLNACPDGEQSEVLGVHFRKGSSYACHHSTGYLPNYDTGRHPWIVCQVVNSGNMMACMDDNYCYGINDIQHRFNGKPCNDIAPAHMGSPPPTPDPNETPPAPDTDINDCSGDDWCENDTGTCASGYGAGLFNGRAICIKDGLPTASAPQTPNHPTAPSPPAGSAPNVGVTDPPINTGGGEVPNPGGGTGNQTIVIIGDGATSPTGSGSGGTGGGTIEVDIETCGLPGKPKCQIDETGTPDGAGASTTATESVETEMGKLGTKLDQVVAGSVAPDRSWGVSFSFPTSCSAMNFGTARWGFFSADFCDWQPIAHDIMSLVWIASTLFLCVGMVFRAISAG